MSGIYVCYLTWGFTQERVSTTAYEGKKFKFFVFLNAVQAFFAALVGLFYMKFNGIQVKPPSRPLMMRFIQLALFGSISPLFGYAALGHIDYPTVILGKSCKLVPVMLMNFVLYGKTFSLKKYLVVLVVTVGVSSFMLLQPSSHSSNKTSSLFGLALLSLNLLIDGATNSTQDIIFSRFKNVSGASMMMYMNLVSFFLMFSFLSGAGLIHYFMGPLQLLVPLQLTPDYKIFLEPLFGLVQFIDAYSTELRDAIHFCSRHPAIIYDLVLFGITGAIGQCFIFQTLQRFGAIVLVTVTVTRKMFSILLSVFAFNHQINLYQWASVFLVFFGITLEALDKGKGGSHKTQEVVVKDEDAPIQSKSTPRKSSRSRGTTNTPQKSSSPGIQRRVLRSAAKKK